MEQEERARNYQTPRRILYVVIGLLLLVYVGYQIYKVNYVPLTTEMAVQQVLYDNISADVFIIRDEETIRGVSNRVMVNAVTDGQRVAAGNPVLYLFANETEAGNYAKALALDKKIAYYDELLKHKSLYTVDPDTVDRSIENTLNQLQKLIAGGKLEAVGSTKEELLDHINQRQLITDTLSEGDLSAKIQELEADKSQVPTANYDIITAPEPGAFISRVDGFEAVADYNAIDQFTVEDIKGFLSAQPAQTDGSIGKLVKEFDWYMACAVDTLAITDLKVGRSVVVDFPFSSAGEINATIERMTSEAGGQSVLILKCGLMNDTISDLRSETAQIRLKTYRGLRVSSKAIRVNEAGEKGVFVLTGNAVEFKKIKVSYTGADFVLCELVNEKGYLELYDEVILSGKNLYDGKIAR